jgi:hypothetical protein
MGLDADFTIHVHWGEKDPITGLGENHPMKDGWAISEQQLHVMRLRMHHRIHAWICVNVDKSANACEEVYIDVADLKRLEQTLKKFATDPEALPACPKELWGESFGSPGEPWFEKELKNDMKNARQQAKKIRKMWKYIEKEGKKLAPNSLNLEHPMVHGYYLACW